MADELTTKTSSSGVPVADDGAEVMTVAAEGATEGVATADVAPSTARSGILIGRSAGIAVAGGGCL